MATRTATAHWEGTIEEGAGRVALGTGAFEGPYSYRSRFEDGDGTNPEELMAASHAGCFTMALSLILGQAGHPAESLDTEADVQLRPSDGGGFEIPKIMLTLRGRVPGIDQAEFEQHANAAKENCPISKALAGVGEIELDARLEG